MANDTSARKGMKWEETTRRWDTFSWPDGGQFLMSADTVTNGTSISSLRSFGSRADGLSGEVGMRVLTDARPHLQSLIHPRPGGTNVLKTWPAARFRIRPSPSPQPVPSFWKPVCSTESCQMKPLTARDSSTNPGSLLS
jgi:hypothetical protein